MTRESEDRTPIDGLLEEWFSGRGPRQIDRLHLQSLQYSPERLAEFDRAMDAAHQDMKIAQRAARGVDYYRPRRRHSWIGYIALATAASLLIGLGLWSSGLVDLNPAGADPIAMDSSKLIPPDSPEKKSTPSIIAKANPKIDSNSSTLDSKEKDKGSASLSMGELPFVKKLESNVASTENRLRKDVLKKDASELASEIDLQLVALQRKIDVTPSATINPLEWAQRAARRVANRDLTDEEKTRFNKKDSAEGRRQFIDELVQSPEFGRYLGRVYGGYLLDKPTLEFRTLSEDGKTYLRWVQSELNRSGRGDLLFTKLLDISALARSRESNDVELVSKSYWWSTVSQRGPIAATDVVHSQLSSRTAACSQCHDDQAVVGANQLAYWGIAAILDGIQLSTIDGRSIPQWKQTAAPMFYERADSTLVAAAPRLPDGKVLTALDGSSDDIASVAGKNLKELEAWVVRNDAMANGYANLLWKFVFGRSLFSASTEDSPERQAIADSIAEQLVAHSYDFRFVVRSLVATEAFRRRSAEVSGDWYSSAGDEELQEFVKRQDSLASFPIEQDQSLRSLPRLATWVESVVPSNGNSAGVLASPLPPTNPGKAMMKSIAQGARSWNRDRVSKLPSSQLQYLINVYGLSTATEEIVDRLVRSKLSWESMVEHAFAMTGASKPTMVELEASRKLLEVTRDERQALLRIIAARNN